MRYSRPMVLVLIGLLCASLFSAMFCVSVKQGEDQKPSGCCCCSHDFDHHVNGDMVYPQSHDNSHNPGHEQHNDMPENSNAGHNDSESETQCHSCNVEKNVGIIRVELSRGQMQEFAVIMIEAISGDPTDHIYRKAPLKIPIDIGVQCLRQLETTVFLC